MRTHTRISTLPGDLKDSVTLAPYQFPVFRVYEPYIMYPYPDFLTQWDPLPPGVSLRTPSPRFPSLCGKLKDDGEEEEVRGERREGENAIKDLDSD
eukprot:745886-Hanusia_phi.AAC.6